MKWDLGSLAGYGYGLWLQCMKGDIGSDMSSKHAPGISPLILSWRCNVRVQLGLGVYKAECN